MDGRWSRRLPALFMAMVLLAGCVSRNETEIEKARARADQARYESQSAQAMAMAMDAQAQAAAMEAQARADAQIGMAQAQSQTAIVREQEKTERETAWLSILPWLLLIVVLGGGAVGAGWLVIWFRGRSHLVAVQTQAAMMLPPPPSWPVLPAPVQRAADENDADAVPDPRMPGAWLLICGDGRRIRMLPPPR